MARIFAAGTVLLGVELLSIAVPLQIVLAPYFSIEFGMAFALAVVLKLSTPYTTPERIPEWLWVLLSAGARFLAAGIFLIGRWLL